jgi:plasmid stabilization system protein ParE
LTLSVRISQEADAEMAEAARWYQRQRTGLGTEFLDAIDTTVSHIAETPRLGSLVPGVSDQAIRRRAVQRFPYHVVYIELSDQLQILAVAHDRRRPGYWVGRLRS